VREPMVERFKLVDELSKEIIDMYDAAEDYSEDQLYRALTAASANNPNTEFIARETFEGAVSLVIEELLTTEHGLEILMRINSYRREQDTDKVTDTGLIEFKRNPNCITVISQNFSEPQPSDYRGVTLAYVPHYSNDIATSYSLKRAEDNLGGYDNVTVLSVKPIEE